MVVVRVDVEGSLMYFSSENNNYPVRNRPRRFFFIDWPRTLETAPRKRHEFETQFHCDPRWFLFFFFFFFIFYFGLLKEKKTYVFLLIVPFFFCVCLRLEKWESLWRRSSGNKKNRTRSVALWTPWRIETVRRQRMEIENVRKNVSGRPLNRSGARMETQFKTRYNSPQPRIETR